MSNIAMQGGATGTGTVTLLAPVTSTDRTLTLPDATGTLLISGGAISGTTASFSGNVTLGSSVLATPTGSAPAYLCRAWVQFNGTGTIAIQGSGNVTSITDGGTGTYTINFTTAMPDATYTAVGMSDRLGGTRTTFTCQESTVAPTAAAFRFGVFNTGNTATDSTFVSVAIFR